MALASRTPTPDVARAFLKKLGMHIHTTSCMVTLQNLQQIVFAQDFLKEFYAKTHIIAVATCVDWSVRCLLLLAGTVIALQGLQLGCLSVSS